MILIFTNTQFSPCHVTIFSVITLCMHPLSGTVAYFTRQLAIFDAFLVAHLHCILASSFKVACWHYNNLIEYFDINMKQQSLRPRVSAWHCITLFTLLFYSRVCVFLILIPDALLFIIVHMLLNINPVDSVTETIISKLLVPKTVIIQQQFLVIVTDSFDLNTA